ncbi:MAG: AlpA family phage regulatory protein, partial [Geobacteraceae bacterium]|nr:AlpA family phage regulatory protein [Geobacteraceae bacterium]
SNSTLHRLEKAGVFPGRRRLSTGIVSWIESEVEDWIIGRSTVNAETVQKVAPGSKRGRKPKA